MFKVSKFKIIALQFFITMLIVACAEKPRANIDWNDRRCITFHDAWVKLRNEKQDKSVILISTVAKNISKADRISTGAGIKWVESFTGDSKMVMVAYNDQGEITNIKDMDGVEISLADLDRLGPFINKFDDRSKNDPAFKLAYNMRYQQSLKGQEAELFRAAKRPTSCR